MLCNLWSTFFFLFITIIIITLENVINPHCCFHSFFLGRLNVSMAYIWHTFLVVLFLSLFFDKSYQLRKKKKKCPRAIFEIHGAKDVCHLPLKSFSKCAGFTGVHLGWIVVPKRFYTKIDFLKSHCVHLFQCCIKCCSIKRANMPFHWRLPCSFLSS